jgi:predicted N-acetyltransferase YhbS
MEEQLRVLLEASFPATFEGRIYFKQLPHFRLIAQEGESVLGQLGIDTRIINVGGAILKIFGLIDLCVLPERRGSELASKLLGAAEMIALESSRDFMVLMADRPDLYERQGFQRVNSANGKWLAIEERESVALIERDLCDCIMVKPLGAKLWPSGEIDLLGYLF